MKSTPYQKKIPIMTYRYVFMLIALLSLVCIKSFAQAKLSGPTCVTTDLVYQYNVSVNLDSITPMTFCIVGGRFVDSTGNCVTGRPQSFVHVMWDGNVSSGNLRVVTSKGNDSVSVQIAKPLMPGTIDSAASFQFIDSAGIPKNLHCSAAYGGSCSPAFIYQWEISLDNETWNEINGGTQLDLNFLYPMSHTTFYRRKVIDQVSLWQSYSQTAVVYVQ